MNIIENISTDNNHYSVLKSLFKISDEVTIASPFLSVDLGSLIGEFQIDHLKRFSLVTTIKPGNIEQLRKLDALISFIDFLHEVGTSVNYEMLLDNKLHAKVYIFKKEGSYIRGIVTSANLTDTGLARNHEVGVVINDQSILSGLESSIREKCHTILEVDDILNMLEKVEEFRRNHTLTENEKIDLDLNSVLKDKGKTLPIEDNQVWLKPEGVTGSSISISQQYSQDEYKFHFSKRRPTGVSIGDKIIAYAVGHGKLLGVFTADSVPIQITEKEKKSDPWKERWPWYIKSKNHTPIFGSNWNQINLELTILAEKYLEGNSSNTITAVGGKTLGALNYGHDKVRLSPGFGQYLINGILKLNNQKQTS